MCNFLYEPEEVAKTYTKAHHYLRHVVLKICVKMTRINSGLVIRANVIVVS